MNRYQRLIEFREAVGGNRFLLALGCSVVNSGFFAFGLLSESGYLTILGLTVGAFIAAGTVQDTMYRSKSE